VHTCGVSRSIWMFALAVLALCPSCSLLLAYDLGDEIGEVACHDGLDNDLDGAVDCDEASCGECVGTPRIACPTGWSPFVPEGASVSATDCMPPDGSLTDGCVDPSTIPVGAMIVSTDDEALSHALTTGAMGNPSGPPRILYLAAGVHHESALATPLSGHVVIRGLCGGGALPVITGIGSNGPIHTDPSGSLALEIDHVEVRFQAAAMGSWSGAIRLDHVRISADDANTNLHFAPRSALVASHVDIRIPLEFEGDAGLSVTDGRLSGVIGPLETTLTRVETRGDVTIAGPGTLVATSLFVHCGRITLTDGAGAHLSESVIDVGPGTIGGMRVVGSVAFRSSVVIDDFVSRTVTSCPGDVSLREGYARADLQMHRALIADGFPLSFGDDTHAALQDVTVEAGGRADGLVVAAQLDADRIRVRGASQAGVVVQATGTDSVAHLTHVYVDAVGTDGADPCSPGTAVGVFVSGPSMIGRSYGGSAMVTLGASHLTNVGGCGLFAMAGALIDVSNTRVDTSTYGVCAPGFPDVSMFDGLATDGATTRSSTDAMLCSGNQCPAPAACKTIQVAAADEVDLLFMIDDSNSMTEEQLSVASEIPRMVQVLASGDLDGDGARDFSPARSLHVGIVDSDMGSGSTPGIPNCAPGLGDDGVMQIRTRSGSGGCLADYSGSYPATPNVFAFEAGGTQMPADFAADVGCVALLGTGGCGFEFELEAPLKALSLSPNADGTSPVSWTAPGYRPPTFAGGTLGHGDDPLTNGAFLRADSLLAIVTVNDEDDCSTPNYEIFSVMNPAYDGVDLNLRCLVFEDELYTIDRYIDGFLGLRRSPERLVYATITGVPPDLSGMPPDTILADPRMVVMPSATSPSRLETACTSPGGRGVAYPGRRMVAVAQGLRARGASVSVQSICQADFSTAFDGVLAAVGGRLEDACLEMPYTPAADGTIGCQLFERLPAAGGDQPWQCSDLPNSEAYTRVGVDVGGGEVCRVTQVGRAGAGIDPGWIYDDGSLGAFSMLPTGCGQRIAFSVITPVRGATLQVVCAP
jgi:hypothetical protein